MSNIRAYPLAAFFALAYAIAWAVWSGQFHLGFHPTLLVLGACGPTIAAFLIAGLTGGRDGVRRLGRRALQWQVGAQWYLAALLGPVLLMLVASALTRHLGPGASRALLLLDTHAIPGWIIILLTFVGGLFGGPMNEEFGWRGLALPLLQARLGAFWASAVLGVAWALWHLPLFFVPGTTQADLSLLSFTAGVTGLSFLFTFLHRRTGGSLVIAILFHNTWNLCVSLFPITFAHWPGAGAIWTVVLAILVLEGPRRWFARDAAAPAGR